MFRLKRWTLATIIPCGTFNILNLPTCNCSDFPETGQTPVCLNMTEYLTPLTNTELGEIFDQRAQGIIQYFIKKNQFAEPEAVETHNEVSFRVPKEHTEQWLVQALGMSPQGAGSYPVDAISRDGLTACDVSCLTAKFSVSGQLTSSTSGEKSLGQKFGDVNFGGSDQTLDSLFAMGESKTIASAFNTIFFEKYKKVLTDFSDVKNIYMFFIIFSRNVIYICGVKVNHSEKLDDIVLRSSSNSVWVGNYIDEEFGEVKVYKAKKRLEIRLRPKTWVDRNYTLRFEIPDVKKVVNLRGLSDEEFDKLKDSF
jgi:hypothetical protein